MNETTTPREQCRHVKNGVRCERDRFDCTPRASGLCFEHLAATRCWEGVRADREEDIET